MGTGVLANGVEISELMFNETSQLKLGIRSSQKGALTVLKFPARGEAVAWGLQDPFSNATQMFLNKQLHDVRVGLTTDLFECWCSRISVSELFFTSDQPFD